MGRSLLSRMLSYKRMDFNDERDRKESFAEGLLLSWRLRI